MIKNLIGILCLFIPFLVWGQCNVQVSVTPQETYCGNPFTPTAVVDAGTYDVAFEDNFNNRRLAAGWVSNPGVTFDDPCNKPNDGSPFLWFGIDARENERFLETKSFNVSRGGKICFDLRLAEENGTAGAPVGCEGPDKDNEGVFVQYSINNGNSWVTIHYFRPTPHPVASLVNWNNYCFPIPVEAQTTNTKFRWFQAETSGADVDHWGLDNIQILTNDADYDFSWSHTTNTKFNPGEHIPGSKSFTYTGTYRNNVTGDECSSSVTVNYRMPKVEATADPNVICNNTPVQLDASYAFDVDDYCGINSKGCMGVVEKIDIGSESGTSEDLFAGLSSTVKRVQWIVLASELGNKPGQVKGFYLKNNTLAPADYFGLSVRVTCSNRSDYENDGFVSGGAEVASIPMLRVSQGYFYVPFEACYNWDGVSNLVFSICYENPVVTVNHDIAVQNTSVSRCYYSRNTRNGASKCNETSGVQGDFVPITKIEISRPKVSGSLQYAWEPVNLVTNATIKSPKGNAGSGSSVTYDVTVTDSQFPVCTGTDGVLVTKKNINVGTNGAVTTCRVPGSLNLFTHLGGTPQSGGAWTDPQGNPSSGTIDPSTATAGTYTYTISDPDCGTVSSRVTVTIQSTTNIGTPIPKTVCEKSGSLDLFTLLSGNNDKTGTWKDPKNYGVLSGSTVNINGLAPGDFNFDYVVPASANCPEQTVRVTLTIAAEPNPGKPVELTVCNSTTQVNLMATLTNSPQTNGVWTNISGVGTISGNIWDKSSVPAGSYSFRYTVPAANGCPSKSVVTQVNVIANPSAGTDGTIVVCNSVNTIKLLNYLGGNPDEGGKWIDASLTGRMSASGVLTTLNMAPGTYRFVYRIDVQGCPKSEAQLFVTVQHQPKVENPRDTSICGSSTIDLFTLFGAYSPGGTWTDVNGAGGLVGSVFSPAPNLQGFFKFRYDLGASNPCVPVTEIVEVRVYRAVSAGLDNAIRICEGQVLSLGQLLSSDATTGGSWTAVSSVSGFNASTGSLNTNLSGPGKFKFQYVVNANGDCPSDASDFEVEVVGSPEVRNITYDCINRNRQYQVSFEIFGGDTASYSVSPTGTLITTPVPRFTSAPIASQTGQTFTVSDKNGCAAFEVDAIHDCGCITSVGTVDGDSILVCEDEVARVIHNQDSINDGNDTLIYMLHNGTPSNIGTGIQFSGTGEFTFQPGMIYNYVYYGAAFIASKGNASGIDQSDTCLAFSNSVPIVFHPKPQFDVDVTAPVCQGDSIDVKFTLLKGNFPTVVQFQFDGTPFTAAITGSSFTKRIVATQSSSVKITSAQSGACSVNSTVDLPVQVDDSIHVSNVSFNCNLDNNAYSISFTVTGGNVGAYTIQGINGQLVGSTFVSDFYPNGTAYNFTVSDGSVCPAKVFSGIYGCPCLTQAGELQPDALDICGNDTARVVHDGGQVTDGNDRFYFALHANENPPFDIITTSATPKFVFQPGMVLGRTYYISAMAGDSLANNSIDNNDSCFSQSVVVPVTFYDKPTAFTDVDTVLCQFQELPIPVNITGVGPFQLTVLRQGSIVVYNDMGRNDTLIEYPNAGTFNLSLVSVVDQTNGCRNTANGQAKATVTPSPTATLKGDTVFCDGQATAVPIDIIFQGERPFSANLYRQGSFVDSISTPGFVKRVNVIPVLGKSYYSIGEIFDASPSGCVGKSLDSVLIDVIPNPSVVISGTDTSCVGDSAAIQYTISNLYPGFVGSFDIEIHRVEDNRNWVVRVDTTVGELRFPILAGNNTFSAVSIEETRAKCQGTVSGTASVFGLAAPVANMFGDTVMCNAPINNIILRFTSSGYGGNFIYFSDDTGATYSTFNDGITTSEYVLNVNAGLHSFTLDSVIGNNNFGCTGTGSGNVAVKVKSLPSANFGIGMSADTILCSGDSVLVTFTADSSYREKPYTVFFNSSVFAPLDSVVFDDKGQASKYFTATAGDVVYTLRDVVDGTDPRCSQALNQSITITGRMPAIFNCSIVEDTVCAGMPVTALFTSDAVLPLEVQYVVNGDQLDTLVMQSGTETVQIDTRDGVNTIFVVSLLDSDPLKCPVEVASETDLAYAKPSPRVDSVRFNPNPVCYGDYTEFQVYAAQGSSIEVSYHIDSVFGVLQMQNEASIGLQALRGVPAGIDSVWYSAGMGCGMPQQINTTLTVNPLPAVTLSPDTFRLCAGNSIYVRPVLEEGTFPVSGVLYSPIGEEVPWTLVNENDFLTLQPVVSGDWVFGSTGVIDGNGCNGSATGSFNVDIIPNPIVDYTATEDSACYPLQTYLVNLTDSVYGIVDCRWSIDDRIISAFCMDSLYVEIDEPGEYSVTLWVESKDGCTASLTKYNYLHVFEVPDANFSFSPNPPTVRENLIQFFNASYAAAGYQWQIDTLLATTKTNPVVELPIVPGSEYLVRLVATSAGGCTDTAYATIKLKNETFVYVPNAFTPNNDGDNDIFIPVPYNVDENYYIFEVYNRWGQVIFSTNSTTEGWDGTYQGVKVQHGVYPYRVVFREKDGVYTDELRGHAVIVK